MFVDIYYEILLRNGQKLQGQLKVRLGQPEQDLRYMILDQQGIKNYTNFIESNKSKINKQSTKITLLERPDGLLKNNNKRKISIDSQFQQTSLIFEESRQYFTHEPQKPPLVIGNIRINNSCLCFSSGYFLRTTTSQLSFFKNQRDNQPKIIIPIQNIKQIKSYRKKQIYFLNIIEQSSQIQLKFESSSLAKQWMGYFMQFLNYHKFLQQKQIYSRADSFKKFMQTLKIQQLKIVRLQQENLRQTIHQNLPIQHRLKRSVSNVIKFSQFKILYRIGTGSFSNVYLAEKNNVKYALKQMRKDQLISKNQMKYAVTELNVLIKARKCPYIIPIYYAFQTLNHLYIAIQYIPTGDLNSLIKKVGNLQQKQALILISQLIVAIEHLHQNKILYRDLKPENIMLTQNGHIYLVDFGLSKQLNNHQDLAQSFLGTPLYLAPERFTGNGSIGVAGDIYGVGCILYFLLHGQSPYRSSNYGSLVQKIKKDKPQFRSDLRTQVKDFLNSTLEKNPQKRMQKMSKHHLFSSIDWQQIKSKKQQGIQLKKYENSQIFQINYQLDEDYNEDTYPNNYMTHWQYSFDKHHQ